MLVRQSLMTSNRRSLGCGGLRILSSPFTTSLAFSVNFREEKPPERAERKLKEWRKLPQPESGFFGMFKKNSEIKPKQRRTPNEIFRLPAHDLQIWFKQKRVNFVKIEQSFVKQRHEVLGCELAAAHFLIYRDGKVKFLGKEGWVQKDEHGKYELPNVYHASWQITHLDASMLDLYYEGLENFVKLCNVKWASFKGNNHFDDWCMDYVSANLPNIETLDVSECPKLTERGLEAVYKMYNLKKLIVTDWNKQPSFELTCIMLEDCNPELNIEIKEPQNKKE